MKKHNDDEYFDSIKRILDGITTETKIKKSILGDLFASEIYTVYSDCNSIRLEKRRLRFGGYQYSIQVNGYVLIMSKYKVKSLFGTFKLRYTELDNIDGGGGRKSALEFLKK